MRKYFQQYKLKLRFAIFKILCLLCSMLVIFIQKFGCSDLSSWPTQFEMFERAFYGGNHNENFTS